MYFGIVLNIVEFLVLIHHTTLGQKKQYSYLKKKSVYIVIAYPTVKQGSKIVPSGHPGQVDSPLGQVNLRDWQGIRQFACQLNH